ncbi:MAG: DUF6178 family protein, partial [Deltaproteobacteria bacterium]|nr:DUF6178 family protein [Deltaproteobacteria bacterium]
MTDRSLALNRPSSQKLLARLLDDPALVETVQRLAPRALHGLLRHIGLEDAGEIVALATTDQLRQIFDDDLWTSTGPGKDETFNADRFLLWLEVMLEAGEDFVAGKLTELPEDLVTIAFFRHVFVLDMDELAVRMAARSDDDDLTDKALEGRLSQEFDEYQAFARHHDGWDTLLAVLLALDRNDHGFFVRLLERCAAMSAEFIEDNGGLYDVFTSEEMLEADLASDREDRRAGEGFVAPSAAASLLKLCRITPPKEAAIDERDPITRMHFRQMAAKRAEEAPSPAVRGSATARGSGRSADLEALIASLDGPTVAHAGTPLLLRAGKGRDRRTSEEALLNQALLILAEKEPGRHIERRDELAYLCNVLVAGGAIDGRRVRPFEAVVGVAAACNLGLEELVRSADRARGGTLAARGADVLAREGADRLFRVGFGLACQEAAKAARRTVKLGPLDADQERALAGLVSDIPYLAGALWHPDARGFELDRERQFVATRAAVDRIRAFPG